MAVRPSDPEALHLFQLIGAPLLAVVQAEAQAAQVSADFIRRTGFGGATVPVDATPASVQAAQAAQATPPAPTGTEPPAEPMAPTAPLVAEAAVANQLQDGGDLGPLRIAEFRIDRFAADGTPQPHVARIPVLSLFPIPLLQVKHADFEFDIRVITRVPLEDPNEANDDTRLRLPSSSDYLARDRVELKGFLAGARGKSGGDTVTDSMIKVRVRMEQSDLPAGLSQLLHIMSENVSVVPLALIEQARPR